MPLAGSLASSQGASPARSSGTDFWGEPLLRQSETSTLAVQWIFLLQSFLLFQDDGRLVKRRRALLESNSPRNSQPETHRDDEPGGGSGAAPCYCRFAHRTDRSPHA